MPKLIATFSDGTTITRNSKRTYTHAWRVKGSWSDRPAGAAMVVPPTYELTTVPPKAVRIASGAVDRKSPSDREWVVAWHK